MMATMTRACLLDKKILACMCKEIKSTGELEMNTETILERLEDLTEAVTNGLEAQGFTGRWPRIPDIPVYKMAILRLLDQGLIFFNCILLLVCIMISYSPFP
jgi:hypothetical protein